MALNVKTFTNSDLNGSYQLVYTHNLNTENVAPTLYDDNGIQLITSDNFALGDPDGNNKANIVTLQYTGAITGTHKLLLTYQSAGETVSGRRVFELSEDTPTDDFRIALGKAATPSINMTLTNFFALLLTKLGFLKTSSNLGDLTDSASARTNLGVYSTSQVDAALNPKATLYQSGSGAVLGVANTAVYNPSSNYNPATKLYSEDMSGKTLYAADGIHIARGLTATFDPGNGNQIWKITLPYAMSSSNYLPVVRVMSNKSTDRHEDNVFVTPILNTRTTTTFEVIVYAFQQTAIQSLSIFYELKDYPANTNVSIAVS